LYRYWFIYIRSTTIQAFEKCGLIPLNSDKVLERIPSAVESAQAAKHLDAALIQRLEDTRFGTTSKRTSGKKVTAGQS
jgi:hypothetical protein